MRAITLILMTAFLASVSVSVAQAQTYLEGDGFVFDNGEFYLVPEDRRYGPPPDLADNVSPPEDFYENPLSEPRTKAFAKPGTGVGLDYFPPAPESDTKVVTPITVPETKQVTVIEVRPELKKEPVKKVVVELPATDTTLTVETQKVETVTRPVRVVGGNDITRLAPLSEQFLPQNQKTGDGLGWFLLLFLCALLIGCWFFFRFLVDSYRRRSVQLEELPMASPPLTPAENQSLEEEIETAQAEAQQRADQMMNEAEAELLATLRQAEAAEMPTTAGKTKRKRAARKPARRRKTKEEWIADYKKLQESFQALRIFFSPWKEQKLLPSPDTIPEHRKT